MGFMDALSRQSLYDEDYFENGLISGRSGYLNYRWLPELTIKMAYNVVKSLPIQNTEKVLDFGCAKGFLVKALRILGFDAYGCDISDYAIKNLDSDVRDFCRKCSSGNLIPFDEESFDWLIGSGVLEHLMEEELDNFLQISKKFTKKMFFDIPLGCNGKYIAPQQDNDITHVLRKDEGWWTDKMTNAGWKLKNFSFHFPVLRENWTSKHPKSFGFFILEK